MPQIPQADRPRTLTARGKALASIGRLVLCAWLLLALALLPGMPARAASPDGWAVQPSGTTATLYGIWGPSGTDVFAVGGNGTILHYDGAAWSSMDSGAAGVLYGVWGSSSTDVFAVGESGAVRHYDGTAWSGMASGTTRHLMGVWGTGAGDVFAVGYGGTILHYDGASWTEMEKSNNSHLKSVWGSSGSDVYAAGNNGVVVHYSGVAWATVLEDTHPNFLGMWGSGPDDVFAIGGEGIILHYDGAAWSPMSSGVSDVLNAVWGTSATDVFAAGADGTMLHYDGSAWAGMDSGVTGSIQSICGFSSLNVFAAGYDGTILHYQDLPPVVGSVAPDRGNQGQTLDAVITGSGLDTAVSVSFGAGIVVNSYRADGPGQITASITVGASAAPGARDISVSNPHGTHILAGAFTVPSPSVLGVSPDHGYQGETLEIAISGNNLGRTASVALGEGISAGAPAIAGPTLVSVTITISMGAVPGPRNVVVVTPEGTQALAGGFRVEGTLPALTGVDPSSGKNGQTLDAAVLGDNLDETSGIVFGEGITVNSFVVQSAQRVVASITIGAAAAPGTRDVTVTTVHGTGVLPHAFLVTPEAPVVLGVDPRSGKAGQTLTLAITGANFGGASSIDLGPGTVVESYGISSPDRIMAVVSIAWDAPVGARGVSVTTPGGTAALADGFIVYRLPPGVTGVSPASGQPGETLDVIISGTSLSGTTDVDFGDGVRVNGFIVDSDTQITANITILYDAGGGLRGVRITTANGSVMFPSGFDLDIDGSSGDEPGLDAAPEGAGGLPVVPLAMGGAAAVAAGLLVVLLVRRRSHGR